VRSILHPLTTELNHLTTYCASKVLKAEL